MRLKRPKAYKKKSFTNTKVCSDAKSISCSSLQELDANKVAKLTKFLALGGQSCLIPKMFWPTYSLKGSKATSAF